MFIKAILISSAVFSSIFINAADNDSEFSGALTSNDADVAGEDKFKLEIEAKDGFRGRCKDKWDCYDDRGRFHHHHHHRRHHRHHYYRDDRYCDRGYCHGRDDYYDRGYGGYYYY